MLHGPQRELFELEFAIPSECADRLATGAADIGIVPSFELTRQSLAIIPGAGIACHGAVRSILLVSTCPAPEIRTLAADSSSRTSVELARVILSRKFRAHPEITRHAPDLDAMLRHADAALVIGDPALHLDPSRLPFHVYDLGAEWVDLTGMPMVFAVWAARPDRISDGLASAFQASCHYGLERISDIVAAEAPARGLSPELARDYLTHNIVHCLSERDYDGMRRFLEFAR